MGDIATERELHAASIEKASASAHDALRTKMSVRGRIAIEAAGTVGGVSTGFSEV